jgi:uncharacterized protein YqhQ
MIGMDEKLPSYGGQAVIEGVMMRGSQSVAVAMRAPNQEIVLHTEPLSGIYKSNIIKIPFLRGLVALWDALGLGIRALTLSANTQTGDDEKLEGPALYLALTLSLGFGIALFFLLPAGIGQLGEKLLNLNTWWSNLLEGLVRLGLLIGYIWAIGTTPDVRRVFAYHGAEHKTINAFEAGTDLVPEKVANHSVEHARCGTAFLLTLVLLSVLLFSLLGPLPLGLRLLSRILLLPVLAGLAYEYIRWTARHMDSPFVRLIVRPNLALQHLTTREPSLDMLEVAIAAFEAMRSQEKPTGVDEVKLSV